MLGLSAACTHNAEQDRTITAHIADFNRPRLAGHSIALIFQLNCAFQRSALFQPAAGAPGVC
jgi:hypothetical protein